MHASKLAVAIAIGSGGNGSQSSSSSSSSRSVVALVCFAFGELITLSEGRKDDEDFFEISFHFNLSFLRHIY